MQLTSLLLAALTALQASTVPCPTCPWHPVNAQRTDVTHAFHCDGDTARLSYSNRYKFDPNSSGRSAHLLGIRTSFRALTRAERDRLAGSFAKYAIIERVKGRCFQGDFLIDIFGVSKAEYDYQATHARSRTPGEAILTVTIRREAGVEVAEIGWRNPLDANEPAP